MTCMVMIDPLCTGLDEHLAGHFSHLFIRDPISLFEEKVQQDPEKETDHFEVIHMLVHFAC